MQWIMIIAVFLAGCSTTSNPKKKHATDKQIIYTPVDKKLIKDVKPYSNKPEPTLKDKIKQDRNNECMERVRQINENNHIEPNFLQELIDEYSCHD